MQRDVIIVVIALSCACTAFLLILIAWCREELMKILLICWKERAYTTIGYDKTGKYDQTTDCELEEVKEAVVSPYEFRIPPPMKAYNIQHKLSKEYRSSSTESTSTPPSSPRLPIVIEPSKWNAITRHVRASEVDPPNTATVNGMQKKLRIPGKYDDLIASPRRPLQRGSFDVSLYRSTRAHSLLPVHGKIRFQLQFEGKNRLLVMLKLVQLSNVKPGPIFISAVLLPARSYVYMSTKRMCFNEKTEFDDKFFLECRKFPNEVSYTSHTLVMRVYSVIDQSKHSMIGEGRCPMMKRDIFNNIPSDVSLHINPPISYNEVGDIEVMLKYLPDEEELVLVIKTVCRINDARESEDFDVKVSLVNERKRLIAKFDEDSAKISKSKHSRRFKKNSHCKKHAHTTIGNILRLKVHNEDFLETALTVKIHSSQSKSKNYIGQTSIGSAHLDACGEEHWELTRNSPRTEIVAWHPIYHNA